MIKGTFTDRMIVLFVQYCLFSIMQNVNFYNEPASFIARKTFIIHPFLHLVVSSFARASFHAHRVRVFKRGREKKENATKCEQVPDKTVFFFLLQGS